MLDTVLQIGKTLRNSPNGLKYHRYIKSPTQQKEWEKNITFLSLPVNSDFSFNFDEIKRITDENTINNKLYYLTNKTSETDSTVKYLFGDIYYSVKDGKESGFYRMPDLSNKQKAYPKSSFFREEDDFSLIKKKIGDHKGLNLITQFRNSFKENATIIESLLTMQSGLIEHLYAKENDLKKRPNLKPAIDVFLHFDFNGQHWYEFTDTVELINEIILDNFVEQVDDKGGFILKKYLYKTLSSPEKDLQFPQFSANERYKNKIFKRKEEISDLFYAIDYSKTALIKVPNSNIKIIVLPKGNNLGPKEYLDFLKPSDSLIEETKQEEVIKQSNELENSLLDSLFENIEKNTIENITQFDIIISKQGGQNNPDYDIIELSGIEKSFIHFIGERIRKISNELYNSRKSEINSDKLSSLNICKSFLNILGDPTRDKKNYQNHLYKVLPQIYSGTYYCDPFLLPVFIEKNEQKIRNSESFYNSFKYDFYFLTKIQNTKIEGENLMKILESPSYRLGLSLGKMAIPLKFEIKSFEKNYVGNLTRRIASLDDLIKFKTDIEQKLIMHEKIYPDIKNASLKLSEDVKSFSGRYDKNECAFGFFENYFKSSKNNENNTDQDNQTEN